MREIIPPIGKAGWEKLWKFFDTNYLHVEQRGDDWERLVRDKKNDASCIAEIEIYHLNGLRFRGDNTIACAVYNFFGLYRVVQRWGLVDDIQKDGGAVAVLLGNKPDEQKWIMAEAGDRFAFTTNPEPPFHTVHLTLLNNKSSTKRTITVL